MCRLFIEQWLANFDKSQGGEGSLGRLRAPELLIQNASRLLPRREIKRLLRRDGEQNIKCLLLIDAIGLHLSKQQPGCILRMRERADVDCCELITPLPLRCLAFFNCRIQRDHREPQRVLLDAAGCAVFGLSFFEHVRSGQQIACVVERQTLSQHDARGLGIKLFGVAGCQRRIEQARGVAIRIHYGCCVRRAFVVAIGLAMQFSRLVVAQHAAHVCVDKTGIAQRQCAELLHEINDLSQFAASDQVSETLLRQPLNTRAKVLTQLRLSQSSQRNDCEQSGICDGHGRGLAILTHHARAANQRFDVVPSLSVRKHDQPARKKLLVDVVGQVFGDVELIEPSHSVVCVAESR